MMLGRRGDTFVVEDHNPIGILHPGGIGKVGIFRLMAVYSLSGFVPRFAAISSTLLDIITFCFKIL